GAGRAPARTRRRRRNAALRPDRDTVRAAGTDRWRSRPRRRTPRPAQGRTDRPHRERDVAEGTPRSARTATRFARPALIDGDPGLVVAPHGRLSVVLTIHIENAKITEINVIGQPSRLPELDISLPDTPARDNIRENARGQIT